MCLWSSAAVIFYCSCRFLFLICRFHPPKHFISSFKICCKEKNIIVLSSYQTILTDSRHTNTPTLRWMDYNKGPWQVSETGSCEEHRFTKSGQKNFGQNFIYAETADSRVIGL